MLGFMSVLEFWYNIWFYSFLVFRTDDGAGLRNVFNIDMVNLLGVFFAFKFLVNLRYKQTDNIRLKICKVWNNNNNLQAHLFFHKIHHRPRLWVFHKFLIVVCLCIFGNIYRVWVLSSSRFCFRNAYVFESIWPVFLSSNHLSWTPWWSLSIGLYCSFL
jgi:hypothetical protein